MRFTLPLKVLVAGIALGAAVSAQAAQCVLMGYFDQNGAVIQTPAPVIGIMIGGAPVVEEGVPIHYRSQQGPDVPCPSEGRRNQAAIDNKTTVEATNQGCTKMLQALQPGQ